MKTSTRIVLIICSTIILLTIVIMSYLDGNGIELDAALQALGVFVAGLIAALGFKRAGPIALLLALCLPQTACIGQPWQVARGTIAGAQGALEAVEPMIPDDAEGRDEALEITSSALAMGELAVDMWEAEATSERPLGWWKWAGAAARGFALVCDLLKRCGVPVPPALSMAAAAIAAMVS